VAEEVDVGVVVLARDAGRTLTTALNHVMAEVRSRIDQLIIVDNGSTDDTFAVARAWASREATLSTTLIRYPEPVGTGAVRKDVYGLAISRGVDVLVQVDADRVDATISLSDLLKSVLRGECDAVTAPATRAGRAVTWLQQRVLGTQLNDPAAGFGVVSLRSLRSLPLEFNADGPDFDSQLLVQLVNAGRRVLPAPARGRRSAATLTWRESLRCAVAVGTYWLARRGFGDPPWLPSAAEYAFKQADDTSHAAILQLFTGRAQARVLDLGCSGGLLAEHLRAAGHHVTGVDFIEIAGARERTDRFVLADLTQGIPVEVGAGYDIVVAGDVIEHLPRPLETLQQIRPLLRPDGELLVSVPNFGHWYARGRVLFGLFGYDRRGILDSTHLRFFTRGSLRRMIGQAGYDIAEERITGLPVAAVSGVDGPRLRAIRRLDGGLIRLWPSLFGYQFVLRATPRRRRAIIVEPPACLAIEAPRPRAEVLVPSDAVA
jgi:SAM-dependent methyltransferase